MKKIAIAGAGEIGAFIAERLAAEKFDVTVIDRDREALANVQSTLDVAGVLGSATNLKELIAADIQDADLFIATTRRDETNLIACLLAHEIKIPHTIAITRYLGSVDKKSMFDSRPLGIDMIVNSSEAVKDEIMETIETTGPSEVATFSEGRIILVGYQVGEHSPVLGHTIAELPGNGSDPRFFVAVLVRKHLALPPKPEIRLEKGDYLYLITTREHLPDFNKALKVETIKTRTAVIYGDNFLSQLVAGALLNRHFHVTLLARSEEKAAFFRNRFGNRRQFHVEVGEGTEVKLLRRVKVPTTSVFLATKSDDASNLTACLVAKNLGVAKTIAAIKRNDILALCPKAGIDSNVAPRLATAKVVQKVVHGGRVLDYRAVSQTNLEVIEVEVRGKCRAIKGRIEKLRLPPGVIIGGIVSKGVPTLPSPTFQFRAGDKAIVFTPPEHLLEVERLFCD